MSSLYSDLQLHGRQIRVLYIQPASDLDDPIQCILKVVRLNRAGSTFDALSYVWGDPHATRTIWVNRQPFKVTSNLFEALTYLRRKRYDTRDPISSDVGSNFVALSRWIWIDAICINQSSILERNAQVSLMKNIYSKASTVHVWLGMSNSAIEQALAFLNQISNASGSQYTDGGSTDTALFHIMDMVVKTLGSTSLDADVRSVIFLLGHPWWRRVWVLQEAILAHSVLLHWHDRASPFGLIVSAAMVIQLGLVRAVHRDPTRPRSSSLSNLLEVLDDTILRFLNISESRRRFGVNEVDDIDGIVQILIAASTSEATDPRDRIYAILGLLPPKLDIRPRYDLPVEESLANAFFQLIRDTKSLAPLLVMIEPSSADRRSWVPDLSASLKSLQASDKSQAVAGRDLICLNAMFRAAGPARCCLLEPTSSSRCLRLRGVLVDTISRVSQPLRALYCESEDIALIRRVTDHLLQYLQLTGLDGDTMLKSPKLTLRFLCTMCLEFNLDYDGKRGISRLDIGDKRVLLVEWRRVYRELSSTLSMESMGFRSPELERAQCFARQYFQTNSGRRLFRTASERVGKAPSKVQTGDVIGLLPGSNLPLVLRPTSGQGDRTYRYIAPCYIHGIMDGELMAGKCQDELDTVNLI